MFTLQRTSSATLEKSPNFSRSTFPVFNISELLLCSLTNYFSLRIEEMDVRKNGNLGGGGVRRGVIWIGRHSVDSVGSILLA